MSAFSIAAGVWAIAVGIANVFVDLIGGVGWSIVLVISGIGAVLANYRVLRFLGARKAGEESVD